MSLLLEKAYFGAGCFWSVEARFKKLKGVHQTCVGYGGGRVSCPSYEQVCYQDTGHVELVRIFFDAQVIPFEKLLEEFFTCHNPTEVNRQGPDVGTQYRSVIFYVSNEQREQALCMKKQLDDTFSQSSQDGRLKVATSVEAFRSFYLAEEYHQNYLEKRTLLGG